MGVALPVGQLFWKYIRGTPLEAGGWTSESLACHLAKRGVIRIERKPPVEMHGVPSRDYYVLTGIGHIEENLP